MIKCKKKKKQKQKKLVRRTQGFRPGCHGIGHHMNSIVKFFKKLKKK